MKLDQAVPWPEHVAITGASSGLGKALALHYAQTDRVISLSGRNPGRLDYVADSCRSRGAVVYVKQVDVSDDQAMQDWLEAQDDLVPVDLLIANAGIGGNDVVPTGHGESGALARQILTVNTIGLINTITPLLPRMVERGSGHIALIGSIAADIGLPQSPAYCASKAAVRLYGDGLRRLVRSSGVRFTTVLPGFVDTPMSQSLNMPRPWCWTADRAAKKISKDIKRNAALSVFPWPLKVAIGILRMLPVGLADFVIAQSLKFGWQPKQPGN